MVRRLIIAPIAVICLSLSGCQVASQLAQFVSLSEKDTANHLIPQDIAPISEIDISPFAEVARHQGEILAIRPLMGQAPSVLTLGQDGLLIGWNLDDGRGHLIKTLETKPRVAALGQRRSLVAWADENGVHLSCIVGCTSKKTLPKLKIRAATLTFHEGDRSLLIGGLDGRVYRWRFMDEQQSLTTEERERIIERYIGHKTMISGVVSHPIGRAFFSSDWDGKLLGWLTYTSDDQGGAFDENIFKGRFYTDVPASLTANRPPDRGISALTISIDGERIGLGTEDGFIEIWQVKGFSLAARKSAHVGRITSIALSQDGERIASVGKDSKVRVHYSAPDPEYSISPTASPMLLGELSEHYIPQAHRVAFATKSRLSVTSKEGELLEVKLSELPVPTPTPTPKIKAKVRDGDY